MGFYRCMNSKIVSIFPELDLVGKSIVAVPTQEQRDYQENHLWFLTA